MKRTILFTTGLATAVALFAIGAQAGPGAGAGGSSGGAQAGQMTQTRETSRHEYTYRYQYHTGEETGDHYGTGTQDRDRIRDRTQLRTELKTMTQVANDLEGAGYKVRNMKTERYRYEAKVTDQYGTQLELKLNPATGAIISQEIE